MLGLTKQLDSIRAKRDAAAKKVHDLRAPERELAELETLERELDARRQELQKERDHVVGELADLDMFLGKVGPLEKQIIATRDLMVTFMEAEIVHLWGVEVTGQELFRVAHAMRMLGGQPEDKKRQLHAEEGLLHFKRQRRAEFQKRLDAIDKELDGR